jgi:hypothetical protein
MPLPTPDASYTLDPGADVFAMIAGLPGELQNIHVSQNSTACLGLVATMMPSPPGLITASAGGPLAPGIAILAAKQRVGTSTNGPIFTVTSSGTSKIGELTNDYAISAYGTGSGTVWLGTRYGCLVEVGATVRTATCYPEPRAIPWIDGPTRTSTTPNPPFELYLSISEYSPTRSIGARFQGHGFEFIEPTLPLVGQGHAGASWVSPGNAIYSGLDTKSSSESVMLRVRNTRFVAPDTILLPLGRTGGVRTLGRLPSGDPVGVVSYDQPAGSAMYFYTQGRWMFGAAIPIVGHEVISVLPLGDGVLILAQTGYLSRWSLSNRAVCAPIGLDLGNALVVDLADGTFVVSGGAEHLDGQMPLFHLRGTD